MLPEVVDEAREIVPPAPPLLLLPPLALMLPEVVDEAREIVPPVPPSP